MSYTAPIADIRFALDACAGLWRVRETGAFPDLDESLLEAILEGVGALSGDVLAPLNASGDREGVRFSNGRVFAPTGFAAAYSQFVEAGWQGMTADVAHGGQGMPRGVALAAHETIHSANMAFGLAPMLTLGAIEALEAHGSMEQKAIYLPKLVSGVWSGTMNLTEPQAGSDVGALQTRAVSAGDGSYRITGQKIFITWGDHDLAENIVHLVLARLPDAPAGSRGVSLFLVPKFLPTDAGGVGQANAVRCLGVERKMGIHGSPTCTMGYEEATGWLIGGENEGLAMMFTMMNSARINVALQGVAVAEAAYQKTIAYAHERLQGRGEGAPAKGASPIAMHADVRRMLLTMRALIQAGRAICYAAGVEADIATHAQDDETRRAARARADLLVPIAKAWCTDRGVEVASLGVQVHGGMGFVEDGGAAQFYRDARIAPIYEGTNGIQAIDLIGRKVAGDGGAAMRALILEARDVAHRARDSGRPRLARIGVRLSAAADTMDEATTWLLAVSDSARRDALAGADTYLRLAGDLTAAMLTARGLLQSDVATAEAQETAALFFAETILALAPSRLAALTLGADVLFDTDLGDAVV
ncbi:MAG: acyl-CoA dehydrogenase [Alphaproteobacteria bacterium]|nr:acyl-CoA dehydrogenase [Alphaproteobacteria bacterium]